MEARVEDRKTDAAYDSLSGSTRRRVSATASQSLTSVLDKTWWREEVRLCALCPVHMCCPSFRVLQLVLVCVAPGQQGQCARELSVCCRVCHAVLGWYRRVEAGWRASCAPLRIGTLQGSVDQHL